VAKARRPACTRGLPGAPRLSRHPRRLSLLLRFLGFHLLGQHDLGDVTGRPPSVPWAAWPAAGSWRGRRFVSSMAASGSMTDTPALLTRTSTPPQRASAASNNIWASAKRKTSPCADNAMPPAASISRTTACADSASATWLTASPQPSCASRRAIARPRSRDGAGHNRCAFNHGAPPSRYPCARAERSGSDCPPRHRVARPR